MKSIRIKYSDYKQLTLKPVKDSYDPETKTIEVVVYDPYDQSNHMDYIRAMIKTVEEYAAEAGTEVTDEIVKTIDEYKAQIANYLINTCGENYMVLAKYA